MADGALSPLEARLVACVRSLRHQLDEVDEVLGRDVDGGWDRIAEMHRRVPLTEEQVAERRAQREAAGEAAVQKAIHTIRGLSPSDRE